MERIVSDHNDFLRRKTLPPEISVSYFLGETEKGARTSPDPFKKPIFVCEGQTSSNALPSPYPQDPYAISAIQAPSDRKSDCSSEIYNIPWVSTVNSKQKNLMFGPIANGLIRVAGKL